MDLPTLRQLQYALALGDKLSFRDAARDCHVTQSSLSAQVQQLEDSLGVKLFERDKRRVIVTQAGRILLDRAQRAVDEARLFVEVSRTCKTPLSGSLCLGAVPTIAPYLLPPVFGGIGDRYPNLRLHLCEDQIEKLIHKLSIGDLDLLLLPLEAPSLDRFVTHELLEDPLRVALPKAHPLAAKSVIEPADLVDEQILLLSDGHHLREQVIELCRGMGVRSYDTYRAGSLTTLVRMVESGLGITLLPQLAVDHETRRCFTEDVAIRPLAGEAPKRTIGLAWRPNCPRSEDFHSLAREVLRTHEGAQCPSARSAYSTSA